MAEKWGFEPQHGVTRLLAFQASPFSLLGISPAHGFYHIHKKKEITFEQVFLFFKNFGQSLAFNASAICIFAIFGENMITTTKENKMVSKPVYK